MHGHVRAGFSAFCLLFALPLALPLLLPLAAQGGVALGLGATAASVASHIEVGAPLAVGAVLLGATAVARRGRTPTAASTSG